MATTLVELIEYYLACLQKERRDEMSQPEQAITQTLLPVPLPLPEQWEALFATPSAVEAAARAVGREELAVLFTPVSYVSLRGTRHEPVTGVFCYVRGGRLRVDPADLWIGSVLSAETSEEELSTMRDALERAVRASPSALLNLTESLIRENELPRPEPCPDLETLKELPENTLVLFPAFWLVEVQTSYDRGLVRELEQLADLARGGTNFSSTALHFVLTPPRRQPPSERQILNALQSPATPTFSQAVALAEARSQPLTVITGPPGTGKTRLIAALMIEHLLEGKSLLLASKINTAVDSAVALIERLLGEGAVLRTGNQEARLELVQQATWLAGQTRWHRSGELFKALNAVTPPLRMPTEPSEAFHALQRGVRCLRGLAYHLQRQGERPLRWWQWLTRYRLHRFEQEWSRLLQEADRLFQQLPQHRAQKIHLLGQQLDGLMQRTRSRLSKLANALESDRRARHRAFRHLAQIGFPVAVTNLAVSANLPLEPALFDTLVIDEASTCDPASLLPLLYRAKRAIIIGDPQQLPHITGEGWKQVQPVPRLQSGDNTEFSAEFGLSAFHLCSFLAGGEQLLLSDHFRCPPPIIAFSNEAFYGGNLRIHTEEREQPVTLRLVPGKHRSTRTGSRLNEAQLRAGIEELVKFAQACPEESLGFVTPYRATADAALTLIEEHPILAPLWQKDRLIVGTAHKFQGNEVDNLVFVTVSGENATERELKWVEHPNLFNVAVTRVRRRLVLIADPKLWEQGKLRLSRKLLKSSAVMVRADSHLPEALLQAIAEQCTRLNLTPRLGCSFRGYPLEVLDAQNPPRWAINVLTWTELQALDAKEVLRLWSEQQALQRWGLQMIHVNPLNGERVLSRWVAERELEQMVASRF